MPHLYQLIQQRVAAWREAGYPSDDYSAIAEILAYATLPEGGGLRFLRAAQLRALETYWHPRLVEGTPHVFDLCQRYYPGMEVLAALGLDRQEIKDWLMNELMSGQSIDLLWERIRADEAFVKAHKPKSVSTSIYSPTSP